MVTQTLPALTDLYHEDETAWLEVMAQLVTQRRYGELDHEHLSEYLTDMAKRDRREVYSLLVVLLAHLLKWEHQPEQRSNSWRGTIVTHRRELRQLLESGTLRNHAESVLTQAYQDAILQAAAETGLAETVFPAECGMTLEEVLEQG
jgi:hypothetical protein